MSYEFNMFAQQGWQCPICKRVYSPTTPMCYYCGNGVVTTSTSTNIEVNPSGNKTPKAFELDWLHHDTKTAQDEIVRCNECKWRNTKLCKAPKSAQDGWFCSEGER